MPSGPTSPEVSANSLPSALVGVGVGTVGGGDGTLVSEAGDSKDDEDYEDKSGPTLQAWYLRRVSNTWRIGGLLQLTTTFAVEPRTTFSEELGELVGLGLLVQRLLERGPRHELFLEGLAGPTLLLPDADFEETLEKNGFGTGPRLGFQLGGGIGVAYEAHAGIRLRASLVAEYTWIRVLDESHSDDAFGGPSEATQTASQLMYMLSGGVEWSK